MCRACEDCKGSNFHRYYLAEATSKTPFLTIWHFDGNNDDPNGVYTKNVNLPNIHCFSNLTRSKANTHTTIRRSSTQKYELRRMSQIDEIYTLFEFLLKCVFHRFGSYEVCIFEWRYDEFVVCVFALEVGEVGKTKTKVKNWSG